MIRVRSSSLHVVSCSTVKILSDAETKACEEGIRLVSQWSEKPVMVELDLDRSLLAYLIAEIRDLVSTNRQFSFVKVERSQNRVSHCLANFARAEARTAVWRGFST
jgi:hypothetical protein